MLVIKEGTEDDCAIESPCSNQTHGLKRNNADKQRCIEQLLKLKPEWSTPKVAEEAGVGDGFVEKVRVGLESKGTIPKVEKREGRDGKLRNATQQKPKPEPAPANPPVAKVSPRDVEEAPAPRPVNRIAEPEPDEGDELASLLGNPEVWGQTASDERAVAGSTSASPISSGSACRSSRIRQ